MDTNAPGRSRKLALLLPDMAGGGAERVALSLIECFIREGHEVDLLLLRRQGELLPLVPAQVRIVDLQAPRIRNGWAPLVRYFREAKPDALQALMWPLTILAVLARARSGSRCRLVLADHTTLSRQYAGRGRLQSLALRKSLAFFYPKADVRVAVSNEAADDLAVLSGMPRDRIDVIYNPVADPPTDPGSYPEVEALWGDRRHKRILTVGKLKEEKEHALLIRSFARMAGAADARLMILGSGEQEGELRRVAAAEGAADRVILPGFTTDPWPYYLTADLFVLSSRFEGYPLVLVEALKCGLAVVSTDCKSGPREILDGGRYGALVPVGDEAALAAAMTAALAAPADRERQIGRAAALSGSATCSRYLEAMLGSQS